MPKNERIMDPEIEIPVGNPWISGEPPNYRILYKYRFFANYKILGGKRRMKNEHEEENILLWPGSGLCRLAGGGGNRGK